MYGHILATLESPEYQLEMQTLSLQPRFTELEILKLCNLCLANPVVDAHLSMI